MEERKWFKARKGILLCCIIILIITSTSFAAIAGSFNSAVGAEKLSPLDATPVATQATKEVTDFSQWTTTQTLYGTGGASLFLDYFSQSTGVNAFSSDDNVATHTRNGITTDYPNTYTQESDKDNLNTYWLGWSDWDGSYGQGWTAYLKLYFANPNPAREYYQVRQEANLRWWIHTEWCHATKAYWYYDGSNGEVVGVQLVACPGWQALSYTQSTIIIPKISQLGVTWVPWIEQSFMRWQGFGLDDTSFLWDYARVYWDWYEYYLTGDAISNDIQLADGTHSFKLVQSLALEKVLPAGTAVGINYSLLTPDGWTDFRPIAEGASIDQIASHIRVQLVLSADPALRQATPRIDKLTITYTDPPPNSEPVITELQQDPPVDAVGYRDSVEVTCAIESYAPVTKAVIQYALGPSPDWESALESELTVLTEPPQEGYRKLYSGIIPPHAFGTEVYYRIYVENTWETEVLSRTAYPDPPSYVTIDNVPPDVTHANTTAWLTSIAPIPLTTNFRIECQVADEIYSVALSLIYLKMTGDYAEEGTYDSHSMLIDGGTGHYYYEISQVAAMGNIFYYFETTDTAPSPNTGTTDTYAVTIDTFAPVITGWTAPDEPEYDDAVFLKTQVIDGNALSLPIQLRWTTDAWETYETSTLEQDEVDPTLWFTGIPAQPWNTQVDWRVTATDVAENTGSADFSFTVGDRTKPDITNIYFILPAQEAYDFMINFTVSEPYGASGIDPSQTFLLYYRLKSENEFNEIHLSTIRHVTGDIWSVVIPAQPVNETVRWYAKFYDRVGNPVVTPEFEYTVQEKATLINFFNFAIWIILIIALTGLLVVGRKRSRTERVSGSKFVGLGVALSVLATAVVWMTPFSWWELHNLSFQEYLIRLGGTDTWVSMLLVLFIMFFTFAASIGALYYIDKRESGRRGASPLVRIQEDLRTLR